MDGILLFGIDFIQIILLSMLVEFVFQGFGISLDGQSMRRMGGIRMETKERGATNATKSVLYYRFIDTLVSNGVGGLPCGRMQPAGRASKHIAACP